MHVCMYAFVHVFRYECMRAHACIYVNMHLCMCSGMNICVHMHVYM